MTERVNFLEKGAYVLTYKKMVAMALVWAAFCFGIFLVESGYKWFLNKSVGKHKIVLAQLNIRKERTMALVEASTVKQVAPDVKELSEIFSSFPVWSQVMSSLSKSMPPQVWLTSITSEYLSENSMARKIELGGIGRNTASIAGFVKQLNDKPLFRNMVLNKSDRIGEDSKKTGYSFVVLGEVMFGVREWE